MKKITTKVIALAAIAISALVLSGFTTGQSSTPKITLEPQDQMIRAGAEATLSAEAVNAQHYQWRRNGVAIAGATQATLSFASMGIQDAGNYSCTISSGEKMVSTRVASVLVWTRKHAGKEINTADGEGLTPTSGGGIDVYVTPVVSSGSSGSCPGNYAGYASYIPTSGWGFTPLANDAPYTASDDTGRTDTSVVYSGRRGDAGCDETSVTIPSPTPSTAYRFTIFFPANVPTTNYPITLTGF
jgi:hypothetical protein